MEAVRIPHSGWPTDRLNVRILSGASPSTNVAWSCIWGMPFLMTSISLEIPTIGVRSLRIWLSLRTGFWEPRGEYSEKPSRRQTQCQHPRPRTIPGARCKDHGRCAEQIFSWCPARPAVSTDMVQISSDSPPSPRLSSPIWWEQVSSPVLVFNCLISDQASPCSLYGQLEVWPPSVEP